MTYRLNTQTSSFDFDKMKNGLPVVVLAQVWRAVEKWPYRFSFEHNGWLYGFAYCERVKNWIPMQHDIISGLEKHFKDHKQLMMDESQETVTL